MNIDITALYACLDDFSKMYKSALKHHLLPSISGNRNRAGYLSLGEMLLIEVYYHFSPFKNFKYYYLYGMMNIHRDKFNQLPRYERFVKLKKQLFLPLAVLLHSLSGEKTGIYFADSTTLKVCRNKRIYQHKTFEGIAARGKSTMGWFYGFKLHMVINHKGQIMAVKITPGNINDRAPITQILKGLEGKCYADKGYIGKDLFKQLWKQGIHLITGIRANMKNYLLPFADKAMLRKRFLIETVFGILKTDMNIEHSRHRSATNALVNLLASLIAYAYKTNKPAIKAFLIP